MTNSTNKSAQTRGALLPHEALTEWARFRDSVTTYKPERLNDGDLEQVEYLANQLDPQHLISNLSGMLRVLWTAQANCPEEIDNQALADVLWLAHELAETAYSMSDAESEATYRLRLHEQAPKPRNRKGGAK